MAEPDESAVGVSCSGAANVVVNVAIGEGLGGSVGVGVLVTDGLAVEEAGIVVFEGSADDVAVGEAVARLLPSCLAAYTM